MGERQVGRHFKTQFGIWVIASQILPRDSGESISAARCLDVSQGPLGMRILQSLALSFALPQKDGHLRPVILKPVGRIFEISDSKPIRRKRGKCGKSLSPQKNKGLRRFRRAKTRKTRKMRKMRTRRRGKCGKCG